MSFKTHIRRSKFKTDEERDQARIESIKKACYKYQQTQEYKDFRHQKYKNIIYKIIKKYIDNTEDDIDDIISDDDTSKEMRLKFKKKYGDKEYKKYLFGK